MRAAEDETARHRKWGTFDAKVSERSSTPRRRPVQRMKEPVLEQQQQQQL